MKIRDRVGMRFYVDDGLTAIPMRLLRATRRETIEANAILQSRDIQLLFHGMYQWDKLAKAFISLSLGEGIRTVQLRSGLAKDTIAKLRLRMLRIWELSCQCGKAIGHKGWCSWRYKHSPARHRTMIRLHKAQVGHDSLPPVWEPSAEARREMASGLPRLNLTMKRKHAVVVSVPAGTHNERNSRGSLQFVADAESDGN